MKSYIRLLNLQIRAQFGLSVLEYNIKKNRKEAFKNAGILLIIILVSLEMTGIYSFIMYKMFSAASTINVPELILTMGAVAGGAIVLFFGIFSIISTLFFAKDTEFLSSMPIGQRTVFISKFTLVLLYEYPLLLFMMLPPVIIYGVNMGCGVFYYLTAIISIILLPVIPLIISALISLVLMKIISRIKRRELFISASGILIFILFFIANNVFVTRMASSQSSDFFAGLASNAKGLIDLIGRVFLPSVWITKALTADLPTAFLNLLLLILSSAAALYIIYFIAGFIYQSGAQAQLETAKSGKTKALEFKSSSVVKTFFLNEWRIILRTPAYALNSLVGIFLGPLVVLMPVIAGNANRKFSLTNVINMIQNSSQSGLVLFGIAAFLIFVGSINPSIATSISREGKSFWILKSIPADPISIIKGKLMCGNLISLLVIVPTMFTMIFVLNIKLHLALLGAAISVLAAFTINSMGLCVDLMRPKLSWNNEQEAIKQNVNAVAGMLAGLVLMSVLGLLGWGLYLLNLDMIIISVLLLASISVLYFAFIKLLYRTAVKKMNQLAG